MAGVVDVHSMHMPGTTARLPSRACCGRAPSRAFQAHRPGRPRPLPPSNAIGVPRVPYRSPKHNSWLWVDIWNCLYRERLIFLSKAVDDELGNQLVATMLYLDSENNKDMNLYINCSGGEVMPCLALADTMRHIKSDVGTVGFGGAMGMPGFLLAVGKKGKRVVLQNTRIMLHHPSGVARGQASDINRESQELLKTRDYMNAVLAEATGQDFDTVARDFARNKYFDAEEAKAYGLIDMVVQPKRKSIFH